MIVAASGFTLNPTYAWKPEVGEKCADHMFAKYLHIEMTKIMYIMKEVLNSSYYSENTKIMI